MKLFAFRFSTPLNINTIRNVRDAGHDILCWSGSKRFFDKLQKEKEFKNTIFDNSHDSTRGIPAKGINIEDFPPVEKNLLDKLYKCETITLRMMEAVDQTGLTVHEKKHIYYQYVRYWHGMLTKHKPDAVVFGDIPHLGYQFVVYHLAKLLGIPTIMYRVIQVPGRLLFLQDIEKYSNIKNEIENVSTNKATTDLSKDIQDFYSTHVNSKKDSTPFYMKKKYVDQLEKTTKIIPEPSKIISHLSNGTLLKTIKYWIQTDRVGKRIMALESWHYNGIALKRKYREWAKIRKSYRKEYDNLTTKPDFSKKYIYVTLHNQPECSTSSMGGVFVDQLLMINMLSAHIPKDWLLFVKESPAQWSTPRAHLGRYEGYYKRITERKNVRIIPTEVSTYKLIEHAQAVASVTGTSCWEALLRGVPAIVFGYTWYMYCDGVSQVKNNQECKESIDQIKNGKKPDKQKVINFLSVIEKESIRAYANKRFRADLKFDDTENAKRIAKGILKELKSITT